jgi:nucleotide-binding universal stress UspA family protein
MRSVLVYVDGSAAATEAVQCVAKNVRAERIEIVHLLNVQPELGGYIGRFVSAGTVRAFQRDNGSAALAKAKQILIDAGVGHTVHIRKGEIANTIVATAADLGVDEIVLGADGLGPFGRLWFRFLAGQVVRRSNRPVMIVKSPPPRPEPSVAAEKTEKLRPAFQR